MLDSVQKVTGPESVEAYRRAIRSLEPKIRRAIEAGYDQIRDKLTLNELTGLIERGDVDGVLRLVPNDVINSAFEEFEAVTSAGYLTGAQVFADGQPPVIGADGSVVNFTFNATNPKVSGYARDYTARRVREIGNDLKRVISETVRDGAVRGDGPLSTARRVRGSIGLTVNQERAVSNYRRMLETGDARALQRELRDRRFDAAARRAIRGQRLSQQQIDRMVSRYRERYIKYRSETIARTETIRSLNGGQTQLMQSYIDQGKISEDQVRRFWHYTFDERTRFSHRTIPSRNPDGVGMREPFSSDLGPIMYPGDPSAGPANTINCRCTVFQRIISAELLEGN